MFQTWLQQNTLTEVDFSTRLFPPATDRAFWEPITDSVYIREAEAFLGYAWPMIRATQFMAFHQTGDRLAQETPHFARRDALLTLVLGEITEYKGRFLPDICDGIFAICEETFWGLSAHAHYICKPHPLLPAADDAYIDLFDAQTAELLSVTYHILHDALQAFCPALLTRIEYELDRRIITPYLSRYDFSWMGNRGTGVNNWNPWILSNILTVFLTVPPHRSQLEAGIRKMFTEINHYYTGLPADGGCDEGPGYWIEAGGTLFAFCDQLYIATNGKIDFFRDEKLHRIGHYEIKAHIDGCYFVNFADGLPNFQNKVMDYRLYGFGLRTGDKALQRFAAMLKRSQNRSSCLQSHSSIKAVLFALIYAAAMDQAGEFTHEPVYVLPDLQCAYLREGDWFYAAKGGHNGESHNHNDIGNVVVYHKGQPVLIDAGCGVYTKSTFNDQRYTIWTMQSGWHNLPCINGVEQKEGAQYHADSFHVEGKTVTVSYQSAYPAEAGVTKVQRRITVQSKGIAIEDSFSFTKDSNTVQLHYLTTLVPEVTPDGVVLGGTYLLSASYPAEVAWKSFDADPNLTVSWGTDGLYRITFTANCPNTLTVNVTLQEHLP